MNQLKELISSLPWEHRNARTISALEKIVSNIPNIPIEELEKLGEKYGI